MTAVDYVLEGLEQWLEVERECGVRTLEVDRSLLVSPPPPKPTVETPPDAPPPAQTAPATSEAVAAAPAKAPVGKGACAATGRIDFAFLHDRPLDEGGREMMAKIITAMGRTFDTAPVIIEHPLPPARAYVVLGARALKKFFPEVKAEPGQWIKSGREQDVLVTYSPAFLLRFPTVTEVVQKMKKEMWANLKDLMRRLK